MIDYGATWIKFYNVEKRKSFRFVSPPTPHLFFYLLSKIFEDQGIKKNSAIIVGFPGVVKNGKVLTAPNLDEKKWKNVNLQQRLERLKLIPYVINDTDLHGHMIVKGRGVELVISLGTGFGSSIYMDGLLVPNTEIGHHLFNKNRTYEEMLGYKAYLRTGKAPWIRNVKLALDNLYRTFNPDRIYLTGDMSLHLTSHRLPRYVKITGNPEPTKKILKGFRLRD